MIASEIRQKLQDAGLGIGPLQLQAIANVLDETVTDPTPAIDPIFDTLRAKGYNFIQRFSVGGRVIRFITNGTRQVITITNNGVTQVYADTDVSTL